MLARLERRRGEVRRKVAAMATKRVTTDANEATNEATAEVSIDEVRAMWAAGEARAEEHREAAVALAAAHPEDGAAQLEAACAWDRAGEERRALRLYEAAYGLGVPAGERRRLIVGYGSTLRNVGRCDDAVGLLAEAAASDPFPAYTAFLALALMDAGHGRAALATMLGCALDAARPEAFAGYERALGEYQRGLLGVPTE